MTAFQEHMRRAGERALEALPVPLRPEIYVISFRIWRHDSLDWRHPYLAIGYNTESEVRRVLAAQGDSASDPGEVRWSYAYWPPDETAGIVGHGPEPADDPVGAALHLAEIKELGLWYEDFDGPGDDRADDDTAEEEDDEEQEARNDLLIAHFDDACVDLARHLHTSGKLTEVLGRAVPILPFDMYRAEELDRLAEEANPPEVIADYHSWARAQEG
ncbi:hypothetical protein SSPS47_15995 [Streptomyces sp. S4.7]|uniref:hypothetical protein n=1 Tax=Streptomyces sp. S4.7 TaxID=2705439 RepID=UPI001397E6B3|nr:hypothetical protein [Streptomyces sp. S4.7]QHY96610.1 hypothetical protein SSPS47_15995 [Streptomyces sp. S4.7]